MRNALPGFRYRTKPPLGRMLDRAHPMARGLVGLWLENEGTGYSVADLTGANAGAANGSPSWTISDKGPCLNFNGSSQYVATTTLPGFGTACPAGFTMFARFKSSYTGNYQAIFGSQGSSGAAISLYTNFGSSVQAGAVQSVVRNASGTTQIFDTRSVGNVGVSNGTWQDIVWTAYPAANVQYLWLNGVAIPSWAGVSGSDSALPTVGELANTMAIGRRNGLNDGYWNGQIDMGGITLSPWGATQAANFHADPYQMILPPPIRRMYSFGGVKPFWFQDQDLVGGTSDLSLGF